MDVKKLALLVGALVIAVITAVMVLSHASEEGASADSAAAASAKSLVGNLKSMLSKPKAQAA